MRYVDDVKNDVMEWIKNNVDLSEYESREDAEEDLNDSLWIEDSVTGNGSGSYTFDSEEAKKNVFDDTSAVIDAIVEFCVPKEEVSDHFVRGDWEWFDVTARCYVLGAAISEALDDLWKEE